VILARENPRNVAFRFMLSDVTGNLEGGVNAVDRNMRVQLPEKTEIILRIVKTDSGAYPAT
jgi:hypothetical protein